MVSVSDRPSILMKKMQISTLKNQKTYHQHAFAIDCCTRCTVGRQARIAAGTVVVGMGSFLWVRCWILVILIVCGREKNVQFGENFTIGGQIKVKKFFFKQQQKTKHKNSRTKCHRHNWPRTPSDEPRSSHCTAPSFAPLTSGPSSK